eukprot:TRINITY_DN1325_c0_g1_i10.p1 TRINITY_DN1325_c0_g1~~TRINITY_DN1325_c0_g1_i10.p1  ORF type:complete len:1309 (+),score=319.57 TRINITY_DN1325_c0_g1_i10:273-4199(+)
MSARLPTLEAFYGDKGVDQLTYENILCARCGKAAKGRCARCKHVHYCSADCQRLEWPQHNITCHSSTSTSKPHEAPDLHAPLVVDNRKAKKLVHLWAEKRTLRGKWQKIMQTKVAVVPVERNRDEVLAVLRGSPLSPNVIAAACGTIVRPFISSTFTDTAFERDMLIADVYPYVKEYGMMNGVEFFQPSELRWGIRSEVADTHQTSNTCMAEIARCQRDSLGISFILFLGNKYGYRPFPAEISVDELKLLLSHVSDSSDAALVRQWFLLNENTVPPQYELQPTWLAEGGKSAWWSIFVRLQRILAQAAALCLSPERRQVYIRSVTEEEVSNGLLEPHRLRTLNTDSVFVFSRQIPSLANQAGVVKDYMDMGENGVDVEAQTLLEKLRERAKEIAVPAGRFKEYTVGWVENGVTANDPVQLEYLKTFCDDVCEILIDSINKVSKKRAIVPDTEFDEVVTHALFCRERAASFLTTTSTEKILTEISKYLVASEPVEGIQQPFVVSGISGSGKTSLMAAAWTAARSLNAASTLVLRFLGTSAASSTARQLLLSLCKQLGRVMPHGTVLPDLPDTYTDLCDIFPQYLRLAATADRPLWLFLDSLDQLSDEDQGRNLLWLPKALPPFVRVVVSTLPDEGGCLRVLTERLGDQFEKLSCIVSPMSVDDGERILESWLATGRRSMTPQQKQVVLTAFSVCPSPLFLKIAFEISRPWKSWTKVESLPTTIIELIGSFFDQLCEKHGRVFVSATLSYITASMGGIGTSELLDILSLDDTVLKDVFEWWVPPLRRIPPLLITRLLSDISPFVAIRGSSDSPLSLNSWFHRQFIEVSRQRFMGSEAQTEAVHRALSEYYLGIWANGKPVDGVLEDRFVSAQPLYLREREPNWRKIRALPYHLSNAKEYEKLKEFLTNLSVVRESVATQSEYLLLSYWAKIGTDTIPAAFSQSLNVWRTNTLESQEDKVIVLRSAASFLRTAAHFQSAFECEKEALEIVQVLHGPETEQAAAIHQSMAMLLWSASNYPESEKESTLALSIATKLFGEEHTLTANCRKALGYVTWSNGNLELALSHYNQALTTINKLTPTDALTIAEFLHRIAIVQRQLQQYELSMKTRKQAMSLLEPLLGPDHPRVSSLVNGMANVLREEGKLDEALPLYLRAKECYLRTVGPEHPELAVTLSNMGTAYSDLGNYEESKIHFAQALSIRERTLGPKHPKVAITLFNLSGAHTKFGHPELALELLTRVYNIRVEKLGKDNFETGETLVAIAHAHLALKNIEAAEANYTAGIEILKTSRGAEDKKVKTLVKKWDQARQALSQ